MYRGSANIVLGLWIDADDHMYIDNLAVGDEQCSPMSMVWEGIPLFVIR